MTLLEEREDARRREIAYFNVSDVMVKGRKTPKESRVYLTVGTIQIDNQSLSSSIPVVVSRTTFMGESQRREKANFEDTLKKESDLQEVRKQNFLFNSFPGNEKRPDTFILSSNAASAIRTFFGQARAGRGPDLHQTF